MGAGIAAQIADAFPSVEQDYVEFLPKELGQVCFSSANGKYVVANCFSQDMMFTTDYMALFKCCEKVLDYMDEYNLDSVAFPHHYGCGIAQGNWDIVEKIIEKAFENKTVKIYSRQ